VTELFSAVGKRVRVLAMTGKSLFGYLRSLDGRAAYRLYGLPADAKLIGTTMVPERPGTVAFLLESSEWEPLTANDQTIPEIKLEMLTALMPPGMRVEKQQVKPSLKAIEGGKARLS